MQAQFSTLFNSGTNDERIYEMDVTNCNSNDGFFAGIRFSVNGNSLTDELIIGKFDKTTGVVTSPAFIYPNATISPAHFNISCIQLINATFWLTISLGE